MNDERRNPFEGVTDYFSELARMRAIGIRGSEHPAVEHSDRTHASAWVPATDILASGDDLVIRVELAGVEPADIDVRLTHGALTITGTRRHDPEEPGDAAYLLHERYYGEFRRVITLPDGTGPEDLNAEFRAGLVVITVNGGAAPADSTRIEVSDRTAGTVSRPIGT